jgi:catechol 2,3-dioxygenase-like lactoylglutathione lyase family enzyme
MRTISGVHHVALGVADLEKMKAFYKEGLACTSIFADFPEARHEPMDDMLRSRDTAFAALLCRQEAGGILFELVGMTRPEPRPLRRDFRYGDIGVAKMTVAVADADRFYREHKDGLAFCSRPKSATLPGWGKYDFVYCRDPEGNLIEFFSNSNAPVEGDFGGARWVGVSVTDLERSMACYREHFGLDKVVIDVHEGFSGLVDEVSGSAGTRVRSCLLASRQGEGMVELFEVMQPRGRSIPFATRWGDYGYLQLCLNCADVEDMAAHAENQGIGFLTGLKEFDGEPVGYFIYIQDPDGIPVEFLDFK